MGTAVKLSDEIVETAREEGRLMKRSIAGQVEYWTQLGRLVEASGLLDYESVRAVLDGQGSVQEFTPMENDLYLELLSDELENLDGSDTGLLDELSAGGHPIAGEDEQGHLLVERPAADG